MDVVIRIRGLGMERQFRRRYVRLVFQVRFSSFYLFPVFVGVRWWVHFADTRAALDCVSVVGYVAPVVASSAASTSAKVASPTTTTAAAAAAVVAAAAPAAATPTVTKVARM